VQPRLPQLHSPPPAATVIIVAHVESGVIRISDGFSVFAQVGQFTCSSCIFSNSNFKSDDKLSIPDKTLSIDNMLIIAFCELGFSIF